MKFFKRELNIKIIKQFMYKYRIYGICRNFYFKHIYPKYYKVVAFKSRMKNGLKKRTIVVYPEIPFSKNVLFRIVHVLGFRITNKIIPHPFAVIYYQDTTFKDKGADLADLSRKYKIINYHCRDISKENVANLFEKVFGYNLSINPVTESGKFVKKSNLNASHDGRVITGPLEEIEEGFVYQKLINNQINDEIIYDIRTPVYGGVIPFVYYKYSRIENRFVRKAIKAEMLEVNEVFSPQEVQKIALFCKEIALDFGELDILRDNDDGRIYIVDANSTPGDLPVVLSNAGRKVALQRLALAFEKTLLENFI